MEVTIYNFSKQRLETIDMQISEENTTWFDDATYDQDIEKITDFKGGLLISPRGYEYPLWIDGTSRAALDYSSRKALALKAFYIDNVPESNCTRPRNGSKLRSPYGLPPFPPIPGHLHITDNKNKGFGNK